MRKIIKLFEDLISPKNSKKKEIFKINDFTKSNDILVDKITPKLCYSGLSDELWFSLLLDPKYLELPGFPSEEIQLRYTGRSGLLTMQQAYEFYDIIRHACFNLSKPISSMNAILDFGCGWGRIIRFFLRDIEPNKLYGIDLSNVMISICKETNKWCNFDISNTNPPTHYKSSTFDLIYAYSVFSHLSEKYHKAWIEEFHRILRPEGVLIVTTRQKISIPESYNQYYKSSDPLELPLVIEKAFKDYDDGKFVYFGIEGAFGYEEDFYGESFIPEAYVRKEWSNLFKINDFIEISNIDQNIIVAQKKEL